MSTEPLPPPSGPEPPPDFKSNKPFDRALRYLVAWVAPRQRLVMKVPRLLRMTGGIRVFRPEGKVPPGRPLEARPEVKTWLEMSEKDEACVPYARTTWLMPRRTLIVLATAVTIMGTLAHGINQPAATSLLIELIVFTASWRIWRRRILVWLGVAAIVSTIRVGWSLWQLVTVGIILGLAAIAWDIVNAIRYCNVLDMGQTHIEVFGHVMRPQREQRVSGNSIDRVKQVHGFWSNLFGWDIGTLTIWTKGEGAEIVRKHVSSLSQVTKLVDDIDDAGGQSRVQAFQRLQIKALFLNHTLNYDDIVGDVGETLASKWQAQRDQADRTAA